MPRLISRQKSIPNGFRFHIPLIPTWKNRPGSFDNVVQQVMVALNGNPHVARKMGIAVTYENVASMVDEFNARLCQANGWKDYYTADGGQSARAPFPFVHHPDPKQVPSVISAVAGVKKLAAGAALLFEWEESGQPPIEPAAAETRAEICTRCPKNNPEHLSRFFTGPVSRLMQGKFARLHGMNLKTPHDDKLGICDACLCPLKLKVWTPIELVVKHLQPDARAELWEQCWIPKA